MERVLLSDSPEADAEVLLGAVRPEDEMVDLRVDVREFARFVGRAAHNAGASRQRIARQVEVRRATHARQTTISVRAPRSPP